MSSYTTGFLWLFFTRVGRGLVADKSEKVRMSVPVQLGRIGQNSTYPAESIMINSVSSACMNREDDDLYAKHPSINQTASILLYFPFIQSVINDNSFNLASNINICLLFEKIRIDVKLYNMIYSDYVKNVNIKRFFITNRSIVVAIIIEMKGDIEFLRFLDQKTEAVVT